jgi:hypothetical protein
MNLSMTKAEAKINQVVTAWETLRPEKSFAGLTLAQFKTAIQPSMDTRARVETLKDQIVAAQTLREEADSASIDTIHLVVNAVKGDPAEGEDGEFYESLGYVRKSERKSGLSRGKKIAAPVAA